MTPAARGMSYVGSVLALVALGLIWTGKILQSDVTYVSQLGARDSSVAPLFNLALFLLAVSAVLIDKALTSSHRRYVAFWPLALTLLICGLCFGVASVVTCSPGCPVPFTEGALWQDTVHIASAVLGFAMAVVAMAQVAIIRCRAWMRWTSAACLVGVGACALTGALLSLGDGDTDLGGRLEFIATTIAIGWFAVLGVFVARGATPSPRDAARGGRVRESAGG